MFLLSEEPKDDPLVETEENNGSGEGHQQDTLAGAGHFDWIHPQTAAYDLFRELVVEMLADAGDAL